jgi:nitroreductase
MLIDLIKANRSYRRFDGAHPVSRAEVLDLLESCRFVASSTKSSPLNIIFPAKRKPTLLFSACSNLQRC